MKSGTIYKIHVSSVEMVYLSCKIIADLLACIHAYVLLLSNNKRNCKEEYAQWRIKGGGKRRPPPAPY